MLLNQDACRILQSVRQERIFSDQLIYRSQQFLRSELAVLVGIHKFVHYDPRQFRVSLQFLHKPFYRQTVNTKNINNISAIRYFSKCWSLLCSLSLMLVAQKISLASFKCYYFHVTDHKVERPGVCSPRGRTIFPVFKLSFPRIVDNHFTTFNQ